MNRDPKPVSSYFGQNIFDLTKMQQVIPKETFEKMHSVVHKGLRLDRDTADIVARAMKDWAISKGCTHYTHWFQPLTGYTAEKHDSFIDYDENGKIIESFSGKQLIQGEPDASSFPSGGIRATFEARGYTIWDPTSPPFVLEYPHGNTLCIPTVFISFTGETLDKKAPLLRSVEALNRSALAVLRHFKNPATKVFSTLGVEQEYFLIDRNSFELRTDLKQTGRTLFGRTPAKHQQLEDQYFANIPERAFAFMTEVETEAAKLGIPLKTRHNEVAPNQFEVAPIYEDVNVAIDHNQILMDLMERVAKRHGLAMLLHEKPFANINGSGKHNNWAIGTDNGENLLNPGKTPQSNLQFLVFLVATIKAVYKYSRLLRASIGSAHNDHRLGANEAPPAIISVFLGDSLTRVLSDLESGKVTATTEQAWLSIGIDKIPEIPKDNTDRNRTSPFAFTGNKFEFRAVGSSQSPSTPITVLNTAMSDVLDELRKEIEKGVAEGKEFNTAVVNVIRKAYTDSKKVIFGGDGYSDSWHKEAAKRGLPNIKTSPEAFEAYLTKEAEHLFTQHKVYSTRELEAIYHIEMENYIKQVDIEAHIARDMAMTMFFPSALAYAKELSLSFQELKSTLGKSDKSLKAVSGVAKVVTKRLTSLAEEVAKLERIHGLAKNAGNMKKKGTSFLAVRRQTEVVRSIVDGLEEIVADNLWPIPKYTDMLSGL
ncbi:MAG: glutamine synthetase III [Ignavibacteriales bacterium]|nr:glutamine synthetase III [Ignavibacteriales bacterium]